MGVREKLPHRRRSWTQHARIGGQSYFLGFGEYMDGRLGELWIDASREGTFLRSVLGAWARLASVSLQCGTSVSEVANSMRNLTFEPNGPVEGSPVVAHATSVLDWVAQEVEHYYAER